MNNRKEESIEAFENAIELTKRMLITLIHLGEIQEKTFEILDSMVSEAKIIRDKLIDIGEKDRKKRQYENKSDV